MNRTRQQEKIGTNRLGSADRTSQLWFVCRFKLFKLFFFLSLVESKEVIYLVLFRYNFIN